MKKVWMTRGLILALVLSFCLALAACNGNTPVTPGTPPDDNPPGPGPQPGVTYKIEEEFDNPTADYANWNNGEVQNMHEVAGGKLILRHTGVTDYPSKGCNVQVTIDKYPYLAVKVDSLDGPNPTWGLKLMTSADETPSREVQADTDRTGILYYDLRKVDGLASSGNLSFGIYFYILGGAGNSMTVDYVRSIENIPTTQNFDEQGGITVQDGTLAFANGLMTVTADEGKTAKVTVPAYCDFTMANMVDLFVNDVAENSSWALKQGETILFAAGNKYGAFAVDGREKQLKSGQGTFTLEVTGTVTFDQLRNTAYNAFEDTFAYEDDDALMEVWTESGSGYIEMHDEGMLLQKIAGITGNATVTAKLHTNVSVYPKLQVTIASVQPHTVVSVAFGAQTVLSNITAAGTYSCDLTQNLFSDIGNYPLAVTVAGDGDETDEDSLYAVVGGVALLADADMSQNALPPKGEKIEREGSLVEEGNNADNWVGTAKVIARGGKLTILQASTDGYSKGQVFARNVDLSQNRYLNFKVDEVSSGATYKVDIHYNVDMAGQITKTVIAKNSALGVFTVDLYSELGLNESKAVTARIAYDFFIEGSVGSSLTLDYVRNDAQIDEAPEIVKVSPARDANILAGSALAVQASLKLHSGDVTITVTDEDGTDVTADVYASGQFFTEQEGVYTITFSYEGATSVTRTVTVQSPADPLITVTTPDSTVKTNEQLTLDYSLQNAPEEAQVAVTVWLAEENVTSAVLTGKVFRAADTGVYTVKFNYEGATEQSITVTVQSRWTTTEGNKLTIAEKDGLLTFTASADWPKAMLTFNDMVINDAPFLKLSVTATGATYKVEFGDAYYDVFGSLKAESSENGTFYLDLRRAPYEGKFDSPQTITFQIFTVVGGGSVHKLEISAFELVTVDKVPPEIVNVLPAADKTIAAGAQESVGASLKYHSGTVTVKVTDASGADVTTQTVQNGVFSTQTVGTYTVTYSYEGATSVTRTITVQSAAEPIITVTTPDSTVKTNEQLTLNYSLQNAPEGAQVAVTVWLAQENVTNAVLTGKVFRAADTGVYTVKFNYEGAPEQSITVTVQSFWKTNEGSKLTIAEKDGKIYLNASADYPKATCDYKNIVINNTPYVKFTVNEASTAKWKLMIGSETYFEKEVQGETDQKGTFYFDIRTVEGFTQEAWAQEKTVTLGVMVVAYGEKNIIIDSVTFLTAAEYEAETAA